MFRLEKLFRFEASHVLPHHRGKCARLHGHSFVGRIVVQGVYLDVSGPKAGMLLDYGELSAAVNPLVEQYLDHYHLNDSLGLENPTSELIAVWVYAKLRTTSIGEYLYSVEIEETCTCKAIYCP